MSASLDLLVLGNGGMVNDRLPHAAALLGGDFLLDCPHDVVRSLQTVGVASSAIRHVYISHFHADHTFGFPMFLLDRWLSTLAGAPARDLVVYGPKGVGRQLTTLARLGLLADHPAYQWLLGHVRFVEVGPRKPFRYRDLVAGVVPLEHVRPTQGFTLADAGGAPIFSYLTDTRWCSSLARELRRGPAFAWIDLNGGASGLHLSAAELVERGLPLARGRTRFLGAHVSRPEPSLHPAIIMVAQGDRFAFPYRA